MGHCVKAFISERNNLEAIQKKYGFSKVVELPQGFCLLPLLDELYDAIEEEMESILSDDRFQFLSPKIGELLLAHSDGKGIVYFETEYFGGSGDQRAVYVKGGMIKLEPIHDESSINQALQQLGVRIRDKRDKRDEFDEIYLGWFRDNEDWIEQPIYRSEPKFEQVVRGDG